MTDSRTGLVIKAKSMLNEPVRIGLIRFADAYDHSSAQLRSGQSESKFKLDQSEQSQQTQLRRSAQQSQSARFRHFDLSHQPLLVVYTSLAS